MDQHTRKLQEESVTEIAGDRRRHRRYSLDLPLHFEGIHSGTGKILDISTSGVSISIPGVIQPQTLIQFSVDWPVAGSRLTGATPMELVVIGRVVRSDTVSTAVEIIRHQIRVLPFAPLYAMHSPVPDVWAAQ